MNTTDLLSIPVGSIMTNEVIKVKNDDRLDKVHDIFMNQNIHHLPVLDGEGKLVGVISKSDLMLVLDWGTKLNLRSSTIRNEYLLKSNLVEDVMTKEITCVSPTDTLETCAGILKKNKFHALPVIHDNTLVGMITSFDLLATAYFDVPNI